MQKVVVNIKVKGIQSFGKVFCRLEFKLSGFNAMTTKYSVDSEIMN